MLGGTYLDFGKSTKTATPRLNGIYFEINMKACKMAILGPIGDAAEFIIIDKKQKYL